MDIISRKEAKALGLKRYFTGEPCNHGHISERRALNGRCLDCETKQTTQWKKDNPEKTKATQKKSRGRAEYKEARLVYMKEWRTDNKDHRRDYKKQYNKEHPGNRTEYHKRWRNQNPGKVASLVAKRRSSKLERTPSWLTNEDIKAIEFLYYVAGLATDFSDTQYHVDHDYPLRGELVSGLHVPGNLKVMTATANQIKSNGFEPFKQ